MLGCPEPVLANLVRCSVAMKWHRKKDDCFFFLPAAGVDDFAVVSGAVGDVAEERNVHRLQKTQNGKRKTENRKQKTTTC